MKYFNGFSLHGEEVLFDDFPVEGEGVVAGFSYGAQQAFEYVYHSEKRVDRLVLLSPAFFQNQKPSFVRTQLRYFQNGQAAYVAQFLQNVAFPSSIDLSDYLNEGSLDQLESLLTYQWDAEKIKEVAARGTTVEVFLGSDDKIIDAEAAFLFFQNITTTYYLKDRGHLFTDKS